jgi:intracellular sulfur oxidation DsrE/DsrF family protein
VKAEQTLHIDVPVKLEKANVVFNIDHLALLGDIHVTMRHISLLAKHFSEMSTKGQIIAIFHADAAYLTLNDKAYDACRNISTGNPYKEVITGLMKQGVQIELCGNSAKANNWVNADLLPGVMVDAGAIIRLTQLAWEGYVLM